VNASARSNRRSPESWKHGAGRGQAQNRSNPMAGCRVQQTCKAAYGANRQSREERQRRKVSNTWQCWTEADSLQGRNAGQDGCGDNGGGAIFGKPQERKFDRTCEDASESQDTEAVEAERANRSDRTESLKTTGRKEGRICAGNCTRHQKRESPEGSAHSAKSQGGNRRRPTESNLQLVMRTGNASRRGRRTLRP